MKPLLETMPHPMQPVGFDAHDIIRFKANKIVRFLLEWARPHGMDLNVLATMEFSEEDREQFAMLIGYSVSGFGELGYSRLMTVAKADELASVAEAAK